MDGDACIVAQGILGAGYTIAIKGAGNPQRTVVATNPLGKSLEVTADSDLDAMVELTRRVLFADPTPQLHN